METPVIKRSPANHGNRFALLRHALGHQLTMRRSLLPYALAVAVLAHGFWWFFIYHRAQSGYLFMAQVAYDSLSWNQRLMIHAPWFFQICSALFVLAALWIAFVLRGRARSLSMFVLLVLLVSELVCLLNSMVFAYFGAAPAGSIH